MTKSGITSDDHLEIHGVDLVDLCERYGTPLFVFDEEQLRENYRRFYSAFKKHYPKVIVCYSVKTNYNLAICTILHQEGAFAEAASGLDLYVARKAGFPPERIIFDGLFKTENELREALKKRVFLINVESFSELKCLNRVAGELGLKQAIGLRINPIQSYGFLRRFFSLDILCNPVTRFGFSLEDAYVAFIHASRLKNLEIKGVMTHPYRGATKAFLPFVRRIQEEIGVRIEYINFGGGFDPRKKVLNRRDLIKDVLRRKLGGRSKLDDKKEEFDINIIGRSVCDDVKQWLGNTSGPTIVLEPGRYVVGDAGVLLLRVGLVKKAGGYKWIVADGGTNLLPNIWERRDIRVANKASARSRETVNVVGPLLYPNDFVAIKQCLPEIREGDILAVFEAGAYTLSLSNQFLYPRPGVILLSPGGRVTEIQKKETFEDVIGTKV